MQKKGIKNPITPIFWTVFLDMLGVGIIVPVLPALFALEGSSILPPGTDAMQRGLLYGYLIAIYPIMQFFGAPILGALSDKYGRRPLLVLSLFGTFIGYLLFGWAIYLKNLPLLFFARALPGFTGGNISIAYSAISDLTRHNPADRPKYFGLVGMAFGIGFVLGPALGGILADERLVSWFDHSTPFWFTALLTLLNIGLLWAVFPETLHEKSEREVSFFSGFKNLSRAFGRPHLRGIFSVSLLFSLGFSFYTQFFAYYMINKFPGQVGEREVGLVYAWVGIWLVFTQGVLVRRLSPRVSSEQVLAFSILALSLAIPMNLLPQINPWWVLAVSPFIAVSHGMTSPNLTTVVSKQARQEEQGEILGINQSMISIGQAAPPLIAGYLSGLNPAYPLVCSGLVIFTAWAVYRIFFFKKGHPA